MILTMNKYIKTALLFALPAAALSSCNDYLDTMPDNRITLDSEFKIEKMLTSAYPDHEYCTALEMISDNTDDYGERVTSENRWFDDTFNWKDEIETDNSSFKNVWEGCYTAIAATNEVFQAMDELEQTEKLRQLRGEALLCRAYNHFMLGAIFCKAWTQNAANDLGLPYMEKAETELDPKYERGNLADFYNKIQADLEEGLQYVSDAYYTVPKYHFNVKAALPRLVAGISSPRLDFHGGHDPVIRCCFRCIYRCCIARQSSSRHRLFLSRPYLRSLYLLRTLQPWHFNRNGRGYPCQQHLRRIPNVPHYSQDLSGLKL